VATFATVRLPRPGSVRNRQSTQALVAAGMGVTILPGLALQAHRSSAVHTTELPDFPRQIYAVTYGNPPDPPATSALIQPSENPSESQGPDSLAETDYVYVWVDGGPP
jgi:DNA-binding transcriptional LysR family regulator